MKETIQELAAGDTITSTTGVSTVQGVVWGQEILEAAQQRMFFEQFALIVDVPKGNKDWELPRETAPIDFDITSSEGTGRTMTKIDNVTTVTFTPATKRFGVAISRDVVRTSQVDMIRHAKRNLVYDAALNIDNDIATALAAASGATTIFGGDATSRATLEAGDVISTDLVAKANRVLKAVGWQNRQDFILFIPAICEEVFLKDSQFVNASEYGGNEVVKNGEIGRYLGIKVIQTEQTPSFADGGSGGNLAGFSVILLKAKVSYGLAYGERPFLDSEYEKNEAEFRLYLDMTYQADTLQDNAIVLIDVLEV